MDMKVLLRIDKNTLGCLINFFQFRDGKCIGCASVYVVLKNRKLLSKRILRYLLERSTTIFYLPPDTSCYFLKNGKFNIAYIKRKNPRYRVIVYEDL